MRIVITTTLNNNLFHAKLVPLVRSRPDVELVVVSDREGPKYERVTWVYPTGWLKLIGRLPGRFLLLINEVFKKDCKLVMAYSLVPHGLFAVIVAKIRRIPVFLHFIAGPAELRFAHDKRVTDNRLIEKTPWPGLWEKVVGMFAHASDRIFVPGSITAKQLVQEGIQPEKVSILHSTVDPKRYSPPELGAPRDIDIVVCAQLRERKRPMFTLEIFRKLVAINPDIKLCWLGDGIMHEEFSEKINALGLQNNLEWLETDNVSSYFVRSKLFLLCSINEGLSLASLEAMACGVVPIVARCGDMEYAIHNKENGIVLEQSASVENYETSISCILNQEQLWERYSKEAIQEIRENHSFEVAEARWRHILASL
jgi:glycosyltransferase involved in cell wall biosynthesis